MSESPKTDIRPWLEAAADRYMRGETPTAFPSGVVNARWEHNAPLAEWSDCYTWTPETPRPGWTFTAELEDGEKLTTYRSGS